VCDTSQEAGINVGVIVHPMKGRIGEDDIIRTVAGSCPFRDVALKPFVPRMLAARPI
jgi:hypothetical protein